MSPSAKNISLSYNSLLHLSIFCLLQGSMDHTKANCQESGMNKITLSLLYVVG